MRNQQNQNLKNYQPNIFRKIWGWFCLCAVFILLYPFMILFIPFPRFYFIIHFLNKIWANTTLFLYGVYPKVIYKSKFLNKNNICIYCANHTSYLDVPMLFCIIPGFFTVLGKEELKKIPLFGYIFGKLYITVDRNTQENRKIALNKAMTSIQKNRSVVFFPEGGIRSKTPPHLASFNEGAFVISARRKIPVIPIAFIDNWIIYPSSTKYPYPKRGRVYLKDPIFLSSLNGNGFKKNIIELKEKAFNTISKTISQYY